MVEDGVRLVRTDGRHVKPDTVEHPRIDHLAKRGDIFSSLNETDFVGIIIWGRLLPSKQDESPSGYITWRRASNRQHELPNGTGSHSLTFLRDSRWSPVFGVSLGCSRRFWECPCLRHCDSARQEQHQTPASLWFVSSNVTQSSKLNTQCLREDQGWC